MHTHPNVWCAQSACEKLLTDVALGNWCNHTQMVPSCVQFHTLLLLLRLPCSDLWPLGNETLAVVVPLYGNNASAKPKADAVFIKHDEQWISLHENRGNHFIRQYCHWSELFHLAQQMISCYSTDKPLIKLNTLWYNILCFLKRRKISEIKCLWFFFF